MACVPYSFLFCCLELQCYGWTSSTTLDHKDEDSILRMAERKVEGSLSPCDHGAVTPALDFLLKFFWEINFCVFNHFRLNTIQGDTSVISGNKELGEGLRPLPFLSLIHQTQFREVTVLYLTKVPLCFHDKFLCCCKGSFFLTSGLPAPDSSFLLLEASAVLWYLSKTPLGLFASFPPRPLLGLPSPFGNTVQHPLTIWLNWFTVRMND